jgi:hypothetical protein
MAFQLITSQKTAVAQGFSVSYRLSKKGVGTLFVSVPSALAGKTWDAFDTCKFYVGRDDDAGRLLIEGVEDGGLNKVARMKAALVFRVPQQPEWTSGTFETRAMEWLRDDTLPNQFMLVLPKQLFEVVQTATAKPAPSRVESGPIGVDGRPPLSIIGTTLEFNGKRVKLNAQYYKVFAMLWKGWGESIRSYYISTSFQDEVDVEKLMVGLGRDIESLGFSIGRSGTSYKLALLKA